MKIYPYVLCLRNRQLISRMLVLFVMIVGFSNITYSQLDPTKAEPKYEIPTLKYPTADAFVVTLNVLDYGADPTGVVDNALIVKNLLAKLKSNVNGGAGNGGVLFFPKGTYRIGTGKSSEQGIIVPKGVTIRGEWEKPVKGKPIRGTIIANYTGKDSELESKALFILEPSAAVKDLAIWYPDQDPNNIAKYPPSVVFGASGYFGNEYCIAQNITLVNAYSGAVSSRSNGGGAPNAYGIYGTPLMRGIEIDNIAEVGRVERVDFSPEYWIGSGLPDAPKDSNTFKKWLKSNGTAITMRRIDWSYASIINIEGYFKGFYGAATPAGVSLQGTPNGQNYAYNIKDCVTGLYLEELSGSAGVMFHNINMENCEYGIFAPKNASGILSLCNSKIQANKYAIAIDEGAALRMFTNQCTISSGKVNILGGTFTLTESDVNNAAPQITIGPDARAIITGNRFAEEATIDNHSMFECQIDHTALPQKAIPEFPYKDPETIKQKPERIALYVATDEIFGAKNDATTDNTAAIQKALDKAKADGGGIVYLPAGKYKVLGNLTIPSGVELKGAMDVGSVPTGPGSVLEIYAGKGNADAQPFIKMEGNSGLRGLVFNYPEQMFSEIVSGNTVNPHIYPYCIQVAGNDVYLVNLGFRATYKAIDLFTHKSDNFYIEYPAGHVFMNCIRVGSGSANGRICNTQFNTIAYAYGVQSKFGVWPNSPQGAGSENQPCYQQNYKDLQFLILEECENLMLFNNFNFGSNKGTTFANVGKGASGIALGHSTDAAVKALCFEKIGKGGFDMIGSQIVALKQEIAGPETSRYVETTDDFTGEVTLFSGNFWGSTYYGAEVKGGTINFRQVNMANNGLNQIARIGENGKFNIFNSSIVPTGNNNPPVPANQEKGLSVESSVFSPGNMNTNACETYQRNIPYSPTFHLNIDRTGWAAKASKNNSNAKNALDGNVSTRWDTGAAQNGTEWFMVDMKDIQSFNKIVLNQGSSTNDYPREYKIYLSNNETAYTSNNESAWGEPVISGNGYGGSVLIIKFEDVKEFRYIKVTQHGTTTGNYWSISEFYAINSPAYSLDSPSMPSNIPAMQSNEGDIYYANGQICLKNMAGRSIVKVYDISGQSLISTTLNTTNMPVELASGIYIVTVQNNGTVYRKKVLIK